MARWTENDLKRKPHTRAIKPRESQIQKVVLQYLNVHSKVSWACRMNVGAMAVGDRYFKAGFVGCSDIIGQLSDGRFLACEVKQGGHKPTLAQQVFLDTVNNSGGLGFIATSLEDVDRFLGEQ